MRLFNLIGSLMLGLAFSVAAVATASAAETLWKFLPGAKGAPFTTKSGKATFRAPGAPAIVCEKSKGTGELTEPNPDATLSLVLQEFEQCKAGLFPVLSLGQIKEEIVVHLEIHNCLISPGVLGLLMKPLPVHIEIPAVSLLLFVEGSFVGSTTFLATDLKHWEVNVKAEGKSEKQEIKKCEGGVEELPTSTVDALATTNASVEILELLHLFVTAQDPT